MTGTGVPYNEHPWYYIKIMRKDGTTLRHYHKVCQHSLTEIYLGTLQDPDLILDFFDELMEKGSKMLEGEDANVKIRVPPVAYKPLQ